MQKTSYKNLAESRGTFESILARFGLEMSPNAWLHHAYFIVEKLSEVYTNDVLRENFMKQENRNGDVYSALHDITLFHDILPFMKIEDEDLLKRKLQRVLRMSSPPMETPENNEARNTFWELAFFSRLRGANVQVALGNPNPDILARFGPRKYYIQCKRLYSPQRRALRGNIKRAVKQLKNDLSSESDNAFGILAFSVERSLTEGRLMLVTESEQSTREKLRAVLSQFRLDYGHIWQNPDVIQDPRIVAIVLNLVVPGIVEDQNILVTGSQMDIHNTWINDDSFKTVIEDFGSLKPVLEY